MSKLPTEFSSTDIQRRMRDEWDRRISHDYRYWMSDGVEDDRTMWQVGRRDFEIITSGLDNRNTGLQVSLEIGCGVGRLLRAAADKFAIAIGFDVSEKGVLEAKRLLGDVNNVQVVLGNGIDLKPLGDAKVDFAYSFAALSSMPVKVIASYLIELSRVVKTGGLVRLQVYLGKEQDTFAEDTIAIRSFEESRFLAAMIEAGFEVESCNELVLPFEISDAEAGLVAKIVSARRISNSKLGIEEIAEILLPEGEKLAGQGWEGSRTEYLMAIARAEQHMDRGEAAAAKVALEFAIKHYNAAEADIKAILDGIQKRLAINGNGVSPASAILTQPSETIDNSQVRNWSGEIYSGNLRVIADRFPELAGKLERTPLDSTITIEVGASGEPVVVFKGSPLDLKEKPARSGEAFIERTLTNTTVKQATSIIAAGFGSGYHIRALTNAMDKQVHLFEPDLRVLKTALGALDLQSSLARLASISFDINSLKQVVETQVDLKTVEMIIHPQTNLISRQAVDEAKRYLCSERGLLMLRPTIAVIGPIYGGSLPIAGYATRALQSLKQRVRGYDLSEFHHGYKHVGSFLRDSRRKDVLQTHYVEMLSELVLEAITERPVDIVICLAQAPLSPRVLTELRNRGIITAMWFVEDCRRFNTWKEISRFYDYMFVIQKDGVPAMVEAAGAGRAIYLPVGCDPTVHRPLNLTEEERRFWGSDISFLGAGYNNRQQMFALLANRDFKIWGTEWPACPPFDKLVQEKGRRLTPPEYVKIFNATKVNLNLHSSMERDGVEPFGDFINPRTFELAAAGVFQLVDERVLLPEVFAAGKELATFTDRRTLEDQIDYYLAHPQERAEIAGAGRIRALSDHTYEARLKTMLGCIYADRFEELRSRAKDGPWPKTLEASAEFPELKQRFEAIYERGDEPTLEQLVGNIQTGKGALTETEQRLLFLHHIRTQIRYISDLREGKAK